MFGAFQVRARWSLLRLLVAVSMSVLCASAANAQPPMEDPGPRHVGPDIIYLKNEQGKLVPVPIGLSLEKLEELFQIDRGLRQPNERDSYSISELRITGVVTQKNIAELSMVLTVQVTDTDQTVRIPLGLPNAVPIADAQYDGPGEHRLEYNVVEKSYFSRIRSTEANKDHTITLKLLRKIEQIGDEQALALELPNAPLSKLELTIPCGNLAVRVSQNGQLQDVMRQPDLTKVTVIGAKGKHRLTWSKESSPMEAAHKKALFRAEGKITARIESLESVTSRAVFTIRSFGQPVESVRIRVPAGAELIPNDDQDYTVSILESDAADPRDVALVELTQPTSEAFVVRLDVRQTNSNGQATVPLGGFFIEDAFRHSGHLVLAADGDWRLQWDDQQLRNLRQVKSSPDLAPESDVRAVFAYDRQPNVLQVNVTRNTTRIRTKPVYVFRVSNDRVQLSARYTVDIRGAITPSVTFDFASWEVDDVRAEGAILDNEVILDDVSPLVVPLQRNYPRQMNIEVIALKPIDQESHQLTLDFPTMNDATSTSPLIVVVEDENIELTIATEQASRLDFREVPEEISLTEKERATAQCYRLSDWQAGGPLGYEYDRKPRFIQTDMETHVDLTEPAKAAQRIDLDVHNEPLEELRLFLPEGFAEDFDVELDGSGIDVVRDDSLTIFSDASPAGQWYAAPLPTPRLGTVRLTIRFSVDFKLPLNDASTRFAIPLARPEADEVTSNRIVFVAPPETQLRNTNEQWQRIDGSHLESTTSLVTLQSEVFARQSDIEVRAAPRQHKTSTVVDRAMVQTWFSRNARRDRVVALFHGNEDSLTIRLPGAARENIVYARVDGEPQQTNVSGNELTVPVDPSTDQKEQAPHQLEIVYGLDRDTAGRLNIRFPELLGVRWVDKMAWHLVLPPGENLIQSPANMVNTSWDLPFWSPNHGTSQESLESWLGVEQQESPTQFYNEYTFHVFGWPESLQVRTLRSGPLVLWVGLPLLVLTIAACHFRLLRHPSVILTIFSGIILAGLRWPLPVLQMTPYFLFACLVCACVPLLRRWTHPRTQPTSTPVDGIPNKTTVTYRRPDSGSSNLSASASSISGAMGSLEP